MGAKAGTAHTFSLRLHVGRRPVSGIPCPPFGRTDVYMHANLTLAFPLHCSNVQLTLQVPDERSSVYCTMTACFVCHQLDLLCRSPSRLPPQVLCASVAKSSHEVPAGCKEFSWCSMPPSLGLLMVLTRYLPSRGHQIVTANLHCIGHNCA